MCAQMPLEQCLLKSLVNVPELSTIVMHNNSFPFFVLYVCELIACEDGFPF